MSFFLRLSSITLLFLFSSFVNAQVSPGGVAANIGLWLKADFGTSSSTGGAGLTTWQDIVTSVDFTSSGGPTYRNDAANLFNYNPTIDFDYTTSDYFFGVSVLGTSTVSEAAVYIVHRTRSAGSGGGLFNETTDFNANDGRFMAHYPYLNGTSYWYNSKEGGDNWCQGPAPTFGVKELTTFEVSSANNSRTISVNGAQFSNAGNQSYLSLIGANNTFFVGCASQQNQTSPDFYSDALIAEIAVYNGGSNSGVALNKIESYLALKYALTLDNTAGGTAGDYFSTTGANVWDASVTPSYHNDIIGLVRDEDEDLLQKQSHTNDDVTRIYLNTLQAKNTDNTGSFSSDRSYLVIGDNQGALCNTAAVQNEKPAGIYSRLEREWKVQKTAMSDVFSMDITLDACAVLGSVNIADLRLLVDDDGDFTDASIYAAGGGLSFSYSNPVLTITGISTTQLPVNGLKYITIASVNATTPLPIELVSFNGSCSDNTTELKWVTISENNNDYFTIERSLDGINFQELIKVNGAGNSTKRIEYKWNGYISGEGENFYRIKQTDFDGTETILKSINVNCKSSEVKIFPNPFHDILEIKFNRPTTSIYTVEVKNSLGQVILHQIISKETSSLNLNIDTEFSKGFYFIEIFNENEVKLSEKLIRL